MDWKPFWKIIEEAYRPDAIDHFEALKERLDSLKWPEVIEFQAKFDEAIADYNAALKSNPKLASALYGRGLAKQKKGDNAGGQIDMATANLVQSDIADEFAGYGVK